MKKNFLEKIRLWIRVSIIVGKPFQNKFISNPSRKGQFLSKTQINTFFEITFSDGTQVEVLFLLQFNERGDGVSKASDQQLLLSAERLLLGRMVSEAAEVSERCHSASALDLCHSRSQSLLRLRRSHQIRLVAT